MEALFLLFLLFPRYSGGKVDAVGISCRSSIVRLKLVARFTLILILMLIVHVPIDGGTLAQLSPLPLLLLLPVFTVIGLLPFWQSTV